MIKRKYFVVPALVLSVCSFLRAADDVVIASPGGTVQLKLLLNEPRENSSLSINSTEYLCFIATRQDVSFEPAVGSQKPDSGVLKCDP